MDFDTMIRLEPHGPDTYVGVGPRYPWGGLYGGQIVAQALWAAASTVDPRHRVHSLHAYFIRSGDHAEPVRYEVDRVRDGRSFTTRRVIARQAVGAILELAASFQVDEPGPEVTAAPPPADVPEPGALADTSWSEMFDRRPAPVPVRGRSRAWLRPTAALGPDPLLQACALAYMSDDLPTEAVVTLHPAWAPGRGDEHPEWVFMNASLDHSIWFHRPVRTDAWQLHDLSCAAIVGTRGVATGTVHDEHGTLLATVSQEVLLRPRR